MTSPEFRELISGKPFIRMSVHVPFIMCDDIILTGRFDLKEYKLQIAWTVQRKFGGLLSHVDFVHCHFVHLKAERHLVLRQVVDE
jgi:hypothetical protein